MTDAPVDTTPEVEDAAPQADAADPADVLAAPGTLPLAGRRALVTLLTHRFVSRARQKEAWAGLLAHEADIRARLSELFLDLEVDHRHEVAFKRQSGGDDAPVLLRREKPLSRDASFLLVFLRREHAYTDGDDEAVVVSRDQVAEFLGRFHDDTGRDEVRADRRVDAAIAAMVSRDLLEPEPDDPQLFTVSPAIVPLVRPEQLAHLEQVYLDAAGGAGPDVEVGPDLEAGLDLDEAEPDADLDADSETGSGLDVGAELDEPDADEHAPDPTAVALDLDLPLDLPRDAEADPA
ncbi:DUF4194 domain-containing protein [Frigoribacterium sp. CFBP 8766]|uniref:DUF4194 domain-containing protein n=1 Tax=Frigoribacterium sp. CFBP 8766 TaxID=2775273 RepID=UPI00178124AE|nr:DUF4194 domain-containing protein [Frigoribacterium sp. CFBP 8766]MBD8584167.1 DUF4194 domain-containing protein [Frigoribacterium sp. CFBP 8766]